MIADSSFFVSLFLDNDKNHEMAMDIYDKCDEAIVMPLSIIEEIFNVITYKRGVEYSLEAIEGLLTCKDVKIYFFDTEELEDAIKIVKSNKKKMSLNDYEVAYLAMKRDEEVLCFDKQVISLAKKLRKDGFYEPRKSEEQD